MKDEPLVDPLIHFLLSISFSSKSMGPFLNRWDPAAARFKPSTSWSNIWWIAPWSLVLNKTVNLKDLRQFKTISPANNFFGQNFYFSKRVKSGWEDPTVHQPLNKKIHGKHSQINLKTWKVPILYQQYCGPWNMRNSESLKLSNF